MSTLRLAISLVNLLVVIVVPRSWEPVDASVSSCEIAFSLGQQDVRLVDIYVEEVRSLSEMMLQIGTDRIVWSPDGERALVRDNREPNHLILTDSNYSVMTQIADDSSTLDYPSWSTDSLRIAYITQPSTAESGNALVIADAMGNNRAFVQPMVGFYNCPLWSPNDRKGL